MSAIRHLTRRGASTLLRPTAAVRTVPALRRSYTEFTPTPIFALTETEEMLRDSVSRFASETILPKVREMDEAEKMDATIVSQLFEQGLMGIEIPEKYGGSEMNFGACIVAIEELARVDPSVSVMVDVHNTLVNTIFKTYASEHLKSKFLPKLASGSVGSFCLSEPASGSDAFALKTRAMKSQSGGSYTITGQKMWITNAAEAEVFIVFANVAPERGYKGISAFVLEKGMPGFNIAKKEKKLGIKASSTCVLTFDEVEVPVENLLGKEGEGYKYAISILNEGRIGIAAQMTGLALGAWETAVKYVWNDRKQFGQFVGDFQGMQFQIAQARTEIEAARALLYNAVRTKETGGIRAGEGFVREAAMAKLYASQVAERVSSLAIEWQGGMGFVREGLSEKFWRDSKIGAIYEGTSNIQLQTIAKLLQKEYRN
ncbi:acyl-CoA dehydrogenase/oxidase [Tricharina praecox]|uniref:acyl-CoA dehydrogenase/oxidase n=1 Tax=Tricharina praecox TaxID=43433 RepID=UPI00221F9E8C|nr:acyl-CoA dehydrogenase/oxidase [Tricharina praecox]KAI5846166.1 acyl-CoA dehydrogenase/oxidase [Tricharina praecox]